MKKLIFIMMFIPAGLLITNHLQAQVSVSVNIGNQPAWAPQGYDDAQYYYLPDLDMYYDVPAHQFIYLSNRRWVRTAVLPPAYRHYDLYKIHKVVVNEKNPYKYHDRDKQQYAQYRGKFDQQPIRDSRDEKYAHNRNNWDNYRFKSNNGKGNGHQRGNGHH